MPGCKYQKNGQRNRKDGFWAKKREIWAQKTDLNVFMSHCLKWRIPSGGVKE